MKLTPSPDEACEPMLAQLKDCSERAVAAYNLFKERRYREAYRVFPYNHAAGPNLEEFVSSLDTEK